MQEDRSEMARQVFRVCDPFGIRGPGGVERAGWIRIVVGVNLGSVATRHFDGPEVSVIVLKQDLIPVRRPCQRRKKRSRWQRDGFGWSNSQRISEHELIFTTHVRQPGESDAVRRPCGTAIVRT